MTPQINHKILNFTLLNVNKNLEKQRNIVIKRQINVYLFGSLLLRHRLINNVNTLFFYFLNHIKTTYLWFFCFLYNLLIGGGSESRTHDIGIADLCLTSWLYLHLGKLYHFPSTPHYSISTIKCIVNYTIY